MLRRSLTVVLEKNATFDADFATEPYEAAWAGEARWFVRVFELEGEGAQLSLAPQISPDGLEWCPEGSPRLTIGEAGLYSLSLERFGHWLRLQGRFEGPQPRARLQIYLALKE